MRKLLLLALALGITTLTFGQIPNSTKTFEFVSQTLSPATVLLYSQDSQGGMKMRCTATAIEKIPKGYEFVTAAHCGCEDNVEKKTVSSERTYFYITRDEPKDKTFEKADVVGCGYRHAGDDFMILDVETANAFPVITLGKDPVLLEPIINVSSPLGLGKQVFLGSVSSPILDRPVLDNDINWTGAVLLQMFGIAGGSSGSSVICLDQQAICAFVVGGIGDNGSTVTALPVSRLVSLRKSFKGKTYKYWVKDADPTDFTGAK